MKYFLIFIVVISLTNNLFGQLFITELSYNPPENGSDSLEYIEISNIGTNTVDLLNHKLVTANVVRYTFSSNYLLPSNSSVVIAMSNAEAVRNQFNLSFTPIQCNPVTGLGNNGSTVLIRNENNDTLNLVTYSSSWIPLSNGNGHSICYFPVNGDGGNNISTNWFASNENTGNIIQGKNLHGSPGVLESPCNMVASIPSQTNVTCNGGNDGEATAIQTGGASPFNYSWSNGQTTSTVENLASGTYTVTITDANACVSTSSVTITAPSVFLVSISIDENSGTANDGIICNGSNLTLTASGGTSYSWSNGATTSMISVNPTSTSSYTVTALNSNGCFANSSQTITVNESPAPSIMFIENSGVSDNDGIICRGSSTTLVASGGTTYLWSTTETTESISPNITSTTTFTLVATTNGCIAQTTGTVIVNDFPSFNVSTNFDNFTITATEANANYQWFNCENNEIISDAINQTFTATLNGSYAVIITKNDCSDTSECVTFNTIGLKENSLRNVKLFPNPTSSNLSIQLEETMENATIFDISGKAIKRFAIEGTNAKISVEDLKNGIYFIEILTNDANYRSSFVKQ